MKNCNLSAIISVLLLHTSTYCLKGTFAFTFIGPTHPKIDLLHVRNPSRRSSSRTTIIDTAGDSTATTTSTALPIGNLFDFSAIFNEKSKPSSPKLSPERILEIKSSIRSLASGTSNGITASEETQNDISTLVTELEDANVTKDLATSDLLDGSWKLVYSSNGGSSAGKLGPFVGEVEQLIRLNTGTDADADADAGNDDYINYVRLGNGAVEGALTATWDVLSDEKWEVKFETLKFKVLGVTLVEKDLNARGIWRMTYLDEDFRILYAASKAAAEEDEDADADQDKGGDVQSEVKENIYILAK